MNLIPYFISWAALATVVLGLALYRKVVARKEDDYLHVDTHLVAQQQDVNRKLEVIDKWGKILTVIAAVYSLILLGLFLYSGWVSGNQIAQ